MANKSLTTRQKMVFRAKPGSAMVTPGKMQVPRAKRKSPMMSAATQGALKSAALRGAQPAYLNAIIADFVFRQALRIRVLSVGGD